MNDYDDVVSWAPILVILDTHEMEKNPLDGWKRSHGTMVRCLVGRMELCTILMGDRYQTHLPLNDPQSSKIYKKLL